MLFYWKIFLSEYNLQEILLCIFMLLTSQFEIVVVSERTLSDQIYHRDILNMFSTFFMFNIVKLVISYIWTSCRNSFFQTIFWNKFLHLLFFKNRYKKKSFWLFCPNTFICRTIQRNRFTLKKYIISFKKVHLASCKCINALLEKNIYNHRMIDYTKHNAKIFFYLDNAIEKKSYNLTQLYSVYDIATLYVRNNVRNIHFLIQRYNKLLRSEFKFKKRCRF